MNIPELIDPTKDYYDMLGVEPDYTLDEIKKKYKRLTMKYHPDRPKGDEEKFKTIQEAYDVIGDPDRRSQYDLMRREYNTYAFWNFSKEKKRKKSKKKKRDTYFEQPQNRILRDFIIDSLMIFQEQLMIRIPKYVQDDFKASVEWVYNKWNELREDERFNEPRTYVSFGGFAINRDDVLNDSVFQ